MPLGALRGVRPGDEQTEGDGSGDRKGDEHTEGVAKLASAKTRTDYEKAVKSLEGTNFNLVSACVRVFVCMCRCVCGGGGGGRGSARICVCMCVKRHISLTQPPSTEAARGTVGRGVGA
jgi:hypothetical protein